MPEDPELQDEESFESSEEATETQSQESEAEAEEPAKQGPENIPYQRFQEVWNERQEARSYAQQLQFQIMNLQQQITAVPIRWAA